MSPKNYCESLLHMKNLSNMNETDSEEPFKVKKGVKSGNRI